MISTSAITFAGGVITKVDVSKLGKVLIVPTSYYEGKSLVPVTKIAANAFYGAKQVEEIYLSYHLSEIGNAAFAGMTSLKKVVFMDDGPALFSSLTIGSNAFAYSYSLNEVHFESYTTNMHIATNVFRSSGNNLTVYAPNLTNELTNLLALQGVVATCEVTYSRMLEVEAINANEAIVTGVDNAKFNGVDTKQYALLIPEYIAGMKIVGVDIAQPSDLADVTSLFLPDTIRTIGAGSFSNMHVTEIVIPDGVQEIGNGAFAAKYAALHVYYDGDDIDANYFATSSYTAYLHTGATVAHPRNLVEKVAVTPASNFTYEVVRGREVVITGLTGAGRSESTVVLPTYLHGRKVTEIGDGAFAHNSNLTKLTLSKYVAEIGNNVFVGTFENVLNVEQQFLLFEDGNTHFTLSRSGDLLILRDAGATYTTIYAAFSVQKTTEGEDSVVFTFSVPEDVSEIREGAFAGVYSLRKIYGNAYFRAEADNTALVKIGAGEGVTSVLIAVLRTANDATFEIVSNDVYRVGAYAFYGSTLTTIAGIPQTVSELGEGAFENSAALVNIALPEGIAALPARVFYGCSSLVSVNIPNGVNSIGAFAFGKSGLNSIDFTALDLLTSIGDSAFADCGELRTVSFNGTNVTSIGKDAFRGCSKLISIDLFAVNDEATGERRSELTYIGEGAFAGTAITEIVLPENVTRISDYLFDGAKYLRSITALGSIESIGDYAFKDTEALTSIPDGMLQTLRVIGRGAFMGSGLREIALPQSVTEIAPETFKDCKYLTNVTLTSSLRKIGDSAFEGCDGRIDLDAYDYVEVSGGKVYLVNEDEPEDVVRDLINTTTVSGNVYSTIVNGRKIRAVGDKIVIDNRFSGTAYEDELTGNVYRVAYVDDLKVVLRYENGAYVLRIYLGDDGKMTDAKLNVSFGVTKINLGIRVTEIGARAFARTAIESVNLTDSVTKVGDEAFAYNDSLQSVLIGAKLESIGAGVFRGTPNLSGVDVNKKNTHFKSDDDKVLYMYDKVADGWVLKLYPAGRVPAGDLAFVVPADVVGIDEGAFDGCKLERVIVQSGVRSIKKGAFMNAGSLKTVFFDADLTIDADVFEGTTVELDVPMFSTLADFCADHFSTGDVTFKLHTPKSCFEYETTETTVKITRLKSDCAHSHNVLVVPDYIDGRRVTKIGDLAFANGGIVDLTLPVLLDEIGDGAFYGNELATISMAAPRTVTEDEEVIYNNGTFEIMLSYHETDLLYTTLINKVNGVLIAYIDGSAEEYGVPTGVTVIGYGAFYKANVRVVTLGSEVTRIETAAFHDSSVEEVEGLENVVYVGDSAFENTGIREFAFGSALTQIGSAAFAGTNVRSITFGEENATDNGFYRYENNVLYEYGDRMAYTMTLHSVFKAYVADAANAGDFLTVADHFTVDEVEYKLSQIGAYAFKSLDLSGHNGIVIIPSAKNLVLFDGAFVNDTITEVHFESRVDAQAAADKVYFSADTFVYYPQGSALAAALEAVGHVAKSLAVTPKEFLKFTEHEALGTVTVTGTNSSVTNLVIPVYINAKLVTVVGDPAGNSDFANRRIATLVITDRVTELAEEAFKNCVTLREVTLGKGITVIPNGAFEGCSLLKTVTMSEDVTTIGAAAFKDTILTAIPVVVNGGMAKVTEIGASAFENVRSLTEIKFWGTPAGSLAIGDNAFKNCNNTAITMIDVPAWVTLGTGVFYSRVNYLAYILFEGDLWDNTTDVTALANAAKANMELCLANITSPNFVKASVPMNATRLRTYFTIIAGANSPKWSCFTPDECFDWATDEGTGDVIVKGLRLTASNWESELKQYITGADYGSGALYIPEYHAGKPVRIIGVNNQFGANNYITKVVIPDSVTKITPNAFYGFGAADIVVEFGASTLITEIGTHAFKDVDVSSITITGRNPLTIGEEAFIGSSLTNLKITNLNSVGTRAFYNLTGLTKADLTFTGEGATVSEYAFALENSGNTKPGTVLVVKGTLASIAANAFKNNDTGSWKFDDAKVLTIGESAFAYASVTSVPTNVVTIGDYAYEGATILKNGVGNVVVLDVESIGKAAFRNSTITGFTFGYKLTTLYADDADGNGSFNSTLNLAAITYGGGDISNPRFGVKKNVLYSKDEENGNYVAIKFAEKADGRVGDLSLLTEIGYGAFRGSLVSKAAFDVIKIDDYAFANCHNIVCVNNTKSEGLMFGSGLSEIGENAFKGCNAIVKIELQGLAALSIRTNAFRGCTALKEVYISATQLNIASGAFTGASISLVTLDSRYITIEDSLSAAVVFVPFYSTAEATAVSGHLSVDHIIFYTPTECLVVNEEGKFCGASSGCSLHEDHKHDVVYMPLYHSAYKRIVGIFADENKLLDGDGTELDAVYYVYGYEYVYFNGTQYVTATMSAYGDVVPSYVHALNVTTADAVIGLN